MDYLQRLGPLALASRLKNLSDALMQGVSKIYREMEVDFEPRWFPVTHYLYTQGSVSVTSLANALRQSHPAILQVTGVMQKQGLIRLEKDKKDLRKTIIELSPEGRKLAESLAGTWANISVATEELLEENKVDLLKDISLVEKALGAEDIYGRVKRNKKEGTRDKPGSALV
jgi:DNA-binding MarR family transcriptional regulator